MLAFSVICLAHIHPNNQATIVGYNVRSRPAHHLRNKRPCLLAVAEFLVDRQHKTWMRYQLSKQFAIDITLGQWHEFEPKWQQYSINCFLGSM